MGESSSPSDSDFGRISGNTTSKQRKSNTTQTNQSNKARNARSDKERESAFNAYNKDNPDDTMSTNKEVNRNIELARDLEYKAKNTNWTGNKRGKNFSILGQDLGFNMADTSLVGKGLDMIQTENYNNQASVLRGGGKPVFDDKGGYQGVVGENYLGANVYSGNADFSPIGRSQGSSYNSATGTYTSSKIQESNDTESSNVTPGKTHTTATNKTNSTSSNLSIASRRSLVQGGGPDATRRIWTA